MGLYKSHAAVSGTSEMPRTRMPNRNIHPVLFAHVYVVFQIPRQVADLSRDRQRTNNWQTDVLNEADRRQRFSRWKF